MCVNVLQCVAVCSSVLQSGIPNCNTLLRIFQRRRLQSVAECCSVLQGVAGCCNVLQRVAVCCSVLQCVAVLVPKTTIFLGTFLTHTHHIYTYICVAVLCSVLQCVAVCCSELQCVAVCCSVLQSGIIFLGIFLTCTPHIYKNYVYVCVAVCCSVLQCVAVCSSLLQCFAGYCSA